MIDLDPRLTQLPQMQQRGGMFGNPNVGNAIQAAIGGYLAGRGVPGGAQILSQLHQRQMMAQQQAMEEQTYQRHQSDAMSMWLAQQQYKLAHPDDELTQYMVAGGIDPNSPQGKALYANAANNKASPFQAMDITQPDGSVVRQFMRPPSVPSAPVGPLVPIPDDGGPTAPQSGGFPGY